MNWSESIIKLHIYTFPESSSFFLSFIVFVLFFFLLFNSVQYSVLLSCSETLASKALTVLRWIQVFGKPHKFDSFYVRWVFFSLSFFGITRVVGHLSNLPYIVLNKENTRCTIWVGLNRLMWSGRDGKERVCVLPVANLFLLRESLYPAPCSSMSTPDRVLASFINCTARVEGLDGPFESSNLARKDPAPGVTTQTFILQLSSTTYSFSGGRI